MKMDRRAVRRIVLDSSVLIDASRGAPDAVAFLHDAAATAEVWSIHPCAPRFSGTCGVTRWPRYVTGVRRDLLARCVHLDRRPRREQFGQRYGPSHGLDVIDAMFAAAAEEIPAPRSATLNVRHFPMFPGLSRPY